MYANQKFLKSILESPEAQYLVDKHDQMMTLLDNLEKTTLDNWTKKAPGLIDVCLRKPMLIRSTDNNMLSLNFDPIVR